MRRIPFCSRILLIGLFLVSAGKMLNAQIPWYDRMQNEPVRTAMQSLFVYETVFFPFPEPDSVEVSIYTKAANDIMLFVLEDTVYSAGYELTLAIKDESETAVAGSIRRNRVTSPTFEETNARNRFTKEHFRFVLSPGKYMLFIELIDRESKKPIRSEQPIHIPNFYTSALTTTDLFFTDTPVHTVDAIRDRFPVFPAVRAQTDTVFGSSFVIVHDGSKDDVRVKWAIRNSKDEIVYSGEENLQMIASIHPFWIDLGRPLPFGQYTLSVNVEAEGIERSLKSSFTVRWSTHSVLLKDLSETVETLQYVMPRDEWTTLKEYPEEEQKRMIEAFWDEREPDPSTPENELEEEFFLRVAFANEHFFTWPDGRDGWRSDRGRIYIIYGPPTDVERPASAGSSRYEIWYYRHLQRRFVFLDRHGGGDFRLISE